MEGKEYLIFLLIEESTLEDYLIRRKQRNLEGKVLFVTIPDDLDAKYAAALMFHFQASLRKHHKGGVTLEFFYYVEDYVSRIRVFDDHRINFSPCSLYLALKFMSQVIHAQIENTLEDKEKVPFEQDSVIINCLMGAFEKKPEILITLGGFIGKNQEEILLAARSGKKYDKYPIPLADTTSEAIMKRVLEIYKERTKLVYGVGLMDSNLNNLNPYSQRKVHGTKEVLVRANYRRSDTCEKRVVLFNSYSSEGTNILEKKDFFTPNSPSSSSDSGAKPKRQTKKDLSGVFKNYYRLLAGRGFAGYQIFNFDAKFSTTKAGDS